MNNLQGGFRRIQDSIGTGLGIDIGRRINDAISSIPQKFQEVIDKGIKFNSTLEDARLGIAAVLKQFNPQEYKTFDQALTASGEAIDSLKQKALESPATFKELVSAFQAVSGAASSAGIPIQRQTDLIVLMSQTLAGIGIRSEQIIQESRALLTGNINQDAAAAKILEITSADITKAKAQGQLYEFLTQKMQSFAEAGKRGADTYTTKLSNLADAMEQVSAEASKPLFETLKEAIDSLNEAMKTPEFKEGMQSAMNAVKELVPPATTILSHLARNIGLVVDLGKALVGSLVLIGGAGVVLKAISFAKPALEMQGMLKAFSVAGGAAVGLRSHIASLALVFGSFASVVSVVGAGLAGWSLGTIIGEFEVAGLKINKWVQLSWIAVIEVWEKIKAYLTGTGEYIVNTVQLAWEKAALMAKKGLLSVVETFNGVPLAPNISTKDLMKSVAEGERQVDELNRKRGIAYGTKQVEAYAELSEKLKQLQEAEAALIDGERTPNKSRKAGAVESPELKNGTEADSLIKNLTKQYLEATLTRRELVKAETAELRLQVDEQIKNQDQRCQAMIQLDKLEAAQLSEIDRQEAKEKEGFERDQYEDFLNYQKLKAQKVREQGQLFAAEDQQERERLRNRIEEVDINPDLRPSEKREQKILLLQEENQLIQDQYTYWSDIQALDAGDPEMEMFAKQQMLDLEREELAIAREIHSLREPGFLETLRNGLDSMAKSWTNFGQNAAGVMMNAVKRSVDAVSDSIMGLIDGTQTWGQAFAQVARGIIADIIRIIVQWVAGKLIMMALEAIFGKSVAAVAQSSASSVNAAWTPAAVSASIATYGAASGIGLAAFMGAQGVGMASSMALSSSAAGYEKGGIPPAGRRVITINENGQEGILNAIALRNIGADGLAAMNSGMITAANLMETVPVSIAAPIDDYNSSMAMRQIGGDSSAGGSRGGGRASGGDDGGGVRNVAFFDNRSKMKQWAQSQEGRTVILNIVDEGGLDLGRRK
jgi:hypothetical protein